MVSADPVQNPFTRKLEIMNSVVGSLGTISEWIRRDDERTALSDRGCSVIARPEGRREKRRQRETGNEKRREFSPINLAHLTYLMLPSQVWAVRLDCNVTCAATQTRRRSLDASPWPGRL